MASRFALCFGFLVAIATAASSCVVSPQPSPPDLILEDDRIGLHSGTALVSTVVEFQADPGTVHPAEGVVVVTNLDMTDAPSFAKVQPDGSFAIAVPGQPGQSFRFQAKSGNVRSQPVDFAVDASDTFAAAVEDAPSCLVFDPARWIALDGAADARSIVIQNQCSATVSIAAPHLRRGLGGFSFTPTSKLDIAPTSAATLTVHGGAGAEVEDVLVLDVTTQGAPAPARRAITLTVPDP